VPFAVGPTLRCARCLELHHELERIRVIALRRGIIEGLTPGANPAPPNVAAEFTLWLTVNPKPTIAQAWRGGWDRAFAIGLEIPPAIDIGEVTRSQQRPQQFFDEQGIAFGQGVDRLELELESGKILSDRLAWLEDGPQHRGDLVGAETGKPELDSQPASIELVQQVGKAATHFVVAVGAEQQDPLAQDATGKHGKQLQARVVGPVEVFDDQEQRLPGS